MLTQGCIMAPSDISASTRTRSSTGDDFAAMQEPQIRLEGHLCKVGFEAGRPMAIVNAAMAASQRRGSAKRVSTLFGTSLMLKSF